MFVCNLNVVTCFFFVLFSGGNRETEKDERIDVNASCLRRVGSAGSSADCPGTESLRDTFVSKLSGE